MKRLKNTILDAKSGYKSDRDYTHYNIEITTIDTNRKNKEVVKKALFLTYNGLLRVL
jgi:DNA mismatch repair protein MutH